MVDYLYVAGDMGTVALEQATGRTRWLDQGSILYCLGAIETPTDEARARALALTGCHDVVVSKDKQPMQLDLATGRLSRMNRQAAAWCLGLEVELEYAEAYPFPAPTGPQTKRHGGSLATTCTVSGAAGREAPHGPVPNRVGTAADGMLVVATSEGLQGYHPS